MTNGIEILEEVGYFSVFADFSQKTAAIRKADLAAIFEKVQTGTYAEPGDLVRFTAQVRAAANDVEKRRLKKSLPIATFSACFSLRATSKEASEPLGHSRWLCFDFDHIDTSELVRLREEFIQDTATALLFTSPSGEGLKLVVGVNGLGKDNHTDVYNAGLNYLADHFRAKGDVTGKNINRLTYLPYDPHAYYNPNAKGWDVKELLSKYADEPAPIPAPKKPSSKPASSTVQVTGTNAREVVLRLVEGLQLSGGSITSTYDNWLRTAAAVKRELGEAGFVHFDELSQQDADKYNAQEVRKLWETLDVSKPGTNAGTLVTLGRAAGVDAAPKKAQVTVSSSSAKVTQMDIRDAVKPLYSIYFDAGSETYYYAQPDDLNPFHFKPFTAQSTFLNELLGDLEEGGLTISKRKLDEALFNAKTYTTIEYLPMQLDWLLQDYDGTDHLSQLFASIQVEESELFKYQFTKWAVNLVAQAYGDGEKSVNENVLVLVGEQGGGKTGFFKSLLWESKWFAAPTDFRFDNKEHRLLMNSRVLLLLDEMAAYGKADVRQMKAALSEPKVTADRKYKETADYKRNATFAGCSNNTDFLKDDTGDRRFLVFNMVGEVDWILYNAVDKPQLWGQLAAMFKAGFNYKFSTTEVRATIQRNLGGFTMHKPEDTFVAQMLDVTGNATDFMSNADMEMLMNRYRQEYQVRVPLSDTTVRAKLKLLGVAVGQQKKIAGKVYKGYAGVRQAGHSSQPNAVERVNPLEAGNFPL